MAPWVLTVFVCIAIVLVVACVAVILHRNTSKSQGEGTFSSFSPGVWSASALGECLEYKFLPSTSSGLIIPAYPTLQPSVLDSLIGTPTTKTCVDTDTTIAQKMQRVCTSNAALPIPKTPVCVTYGGETVGEGYVEQYYQACTTSQCAGQVSLISIGNGNCLDVNASGVLVSSPCSIFSSSQQFRVTRKYPTSSKTPGNGGGLQGPYAQIQNRDNGLCLTVGNVPGSTGTQSCTLNGNKLALQICSEDYEWIMVPSLSYCPYPGRGPSDQCCSGNINCDNGRPTSTTTPIIPCCTPTPQQFVSSKQFSNSQIQNFNPSNPTQTAAAIQALEAVGQSITYGGSGDIIASNYVSRGSTCIVDAVTTNYYSTSSYNYQQSLDLCQNNPTSCLPL